MACGRRQRKCSLNCVRWLGEQGVAQAAERLAEAGGAPLAALRSRDDDVHQAERADLIEALGSTEFDALRAAERCDKAGNENLVLWLMRWVTDLIYVRQMGAAPRYHPALEGAVRACAARANAHGLHGYYRRLAAARRVASHPLNPRLFAEELLIDYARLIQDKR